MSTNQTILNWGSYTRRHKSRGTQKLYNRVVWRAKDFLPEKIEDATLEHLEAFLASLGDCAPNTYNASITALQSFGKWLQEHEIPFPAKKLKRIRHTHIPARVLTDDEYEKILAVCDQNELDTVQFLSCTGLRAHEFLALTPACVSSDQKFLHIIGKGQKARSVPLNEVCCQIINRHPKMNFSKSYKFLWRLCDQLGRRAKVKHFAVHSLRHTFATRLIKAGVPLYQISKCLGHADTRVTEIYYLHWTQESAVANITDCLEK